jgi:ribonuclease HII
MAWIVGIDEAGYGPNLGPFVMAAVACQAPDDRADANLWDVLGAAVRQGARAKEAAEDRRLLIDDSKVVYAGPRGLEALERGVLAALALGAEVRDLSALLERVCLDGRAEVQAEAWFTGASLLPAEAAGDDVAGHAARFAAACAEEGLGPWLVRSVVVCPPRFNALLDAYGSKGAVLAHALARLLRCALERTAGPVAFFIDKHGGRNAYAAQLQDALTDGVVLATMEGLARSAYRVQGLGRPVRFTFQPRADREHFCVALASMAAKYQRELLMGELNRFWQGHVPGLRPTAGYPGDALRFLEAIRPAARRLGIPDEALWRRK